MGLKNYIIFLSLKTFPQRLASRTIGKISDTRFPRILLISMIYLYSRVFGVNLKESEKEIAEFRNFNEFFTRKLKPGARKIDTSKRVIIAPVDGTVSSSGKIRKNTLIQAKGKSYTLEALLQDEIAAKDYENGSFITIYLRPRDYHRIHAPLSGKIAGYSYIPGALFPVNKLSLNAVDELFTRNERLITYMDTPAGKVAIVKIGACLVGKIKASYDYLIFDSSSEDFIKKEYPQKIRIEKGDELGMFELGSTVILLFQKRRARLEKMRAKELVKMGEKIAMIAGKSP